MSLLRRQFIGLGAASAAGVMVSRCAIGSPQAATPTPRDGSQRPLYQSVNGLLEVALTATSAPLSLAGQTVHLLAYNGQVPGPRLEARPGDRVRIHLTNQLNHPTNLHYHGLHISPTGQGDNVFLSIPPQETLTYEFTLPPNHPTGTFWYHPHHHGHTAEQVFGGLAGLFIVRGGLDDFPEIQAAQEHFLVFQDFDFDTRGQLNPPSPMMRMMGREGPLITVNGQLSPVVSIPAGGWLRLRLLNASPSRFYRLVLEDHPLYLIATDGGAIAAPLEVPSLLLAPGERAEVLVRGDRPPGQYRLLNLPYNRGGMGMMGGGMGGMMGGGMGGPMRRRQGQQPDSTQPLATITYQGTAPAIPLPDRLLAVEDLPEPEHTRRLEFSMTMGQGMGSGMAFLFNGQPFDPNRIDINLPLGAVEDWDLVNIGPGRMDHPFHLHVNAFQVVARNGQPEPYRAWKDTVLVRTGETVRIRVPFRDFAGKTVYHCHILDHEDLGMMGIANIHA